GDAGLRALRAALLGSSTVLRDEAAIDSDWVKTGRIFLTALKRHGSKASATYYLRIHRQYFDGLVRSLRELDRVLRLGAPCVLVVQDSRYKEIHNDLPTIATEMAKSVGWRVADRHDYQSTRHIGRVHRKTAATESALLFRNT